MGQFKDDSIKNVIEKLNYSYFLPDIQREYVWLTKPQDQKIEQLFDSILRGYPIGSFLFWTLKKDAIETSEDASENSGKLNFQLYKFIENYDVRKPHNEKVNIEQINSNDLSIVLDGQQRLSSLYIGLKGTRILKKPGTWWKTKNFQTKHLFINLRYQPDEENPEDNYKFEFLIKDSVPEFDEHNFWFKVSEILDLDSLLTYARKNDLSDKEANMLEKLKNAFCSNNLISYFEETEENLDKVLKIFIRINSGGTQLSYSDILMSILTANFSTDIRSSMNDLVDSVKEQGFSVMGRDQILKTCFLMTESNHIFQLKNFNKSNINKIETNWEKIKSTIDMAIELLKDFGYTDRLSSAYILSVVACYLFKNEKVTPEDKDEILRFVRNAQIMGYFSASLDSRLSVVARALKKSRNFSEVNEELSRETSLPLKITEGDVEGMLDLQYGSLAVLPVLQLLYPNLDYKSSKFHIDHIYPRTKFKSELSEDLEEYKGTADFLYNLQAFAGR